MRRKASSPLMRSESTLASFLFLALTPFSMAAHAQETEEARNASCAALERQSFEAAADNPVRIISSKRVVNADEALENKSIFAKRSIVQGMPMDEDDNIPTHCRIEGYIAPAVKFLMVLPDRSHWNEKAIYAACDAFCGAVQEDNTIPGLVRGYATITTDGGHINQRPFDGIWGNNNREGEIDFGYRASHVAAQTIKAVSKAYYGAKPKYAYITGFSKGGHAGIMSALKYPTDYDGVLSRSPVVKYQEINAVHLPWIYKSNSRADGTSILSAADASFIHKSAIASCDAVDGVTDGIIDDPRDCNFDPNALLCAQRNANEKCLDQEQINALKKLYSRPVDSKGKAYYPYALEVGSELDWPGFHVPRGPGGIPYSKTISSTFLRYMAFDKDPGASFDWEAFDPVRNKRQLKKMKAIFDADSPDLRAFEKAGGKMIVVHGWGDGAVTAQMTIDWYEKVLSFMGKDAASFARLFLMPGNKHGGSPGDGPNVNESLAALEKWVEEGIAPDGLLLKDATRTRPLFPYPLRAKYKGEGSVNDPANYEAISPAQ